MSKTQATVEGYELLSPTDVVRYLSKLPKELEVHISSITNMMNAVQSWERGDDVRSVVVDVKSLLKRIAEETGSAFDEMQEAITKEHAGVLGDLADKAQRLERQLGSRWHEQPMCGEPDDPQLGELYGEVRQMLIDLSSNLLGLAEWLHLCDRSKLPASEATESFESGDEWRTAYDFEFKESPRSIRQSDKSVTERVGGAKKLSPQEKNDNAGLQLLFHFLPNNKFIDKAKLAEKTGFKPASLSTVRTYANNVLAKIGSQYRICTLRGHGEIQIEKHQTRTSN